MKKRNPLLYLFFPAILLLFILHGQAVGQSAPAERSTDQLLNHQEAIRTGFLHRHLAVLADDSLKGRDTGSKELDIAARYLADLYASMGLQPAGDQNSYFQHFSLSALKRDSTVFQLYKGGSLVDRSVESQTSTGNFIRSFGGSDSLSGEIVFAGFGINDPRRDVNHLGDMDLEGKWVLIFQQIPHKVDGETVIDPSINGKTRFNTIIEERGAAGILNIAPISEEEYQATAQKNNIRYAEPTRFGLEYLKDDSRGDLPVGYNLVKPSLAARILDIDSTPEALQQYREELIEKISSFSPQKTGYSLSQAPSASLSRLKTKNVVAMLPGGDPELKDEVVVLTSHYDHVGVGQPDSTGDAIYNGADDDGSGTVAMLNIAHALSQAREAGHAPRRSILFLHVSAEEKGLLGSRYYSDHPVIPMEQTVANINIDMIGRIDSRHKQEGITDYSYIIGSSIISSELDSMLTVANSRSGNIELDMRYNDLQDPNQFYRRSDHWNFGRFGVPFVFFFTGVHEDYHRPSDEVHKIRFDKLAKIVRTIYATTVVVANEEDPPSVDNQEFIDMTRTQPR
ncbi:M28 family peptidase [Halalkalibaculum sp. DA384]|uniref:M28 family peptidase n=1 Tax=Halalkalibaculum sp. DA384 TaxID=3373606 RepID=UPI0037541EDD